MAQILIVDDSPNWRTTVKHLLTDEGYQITTARDESEALSAAVQTSFDLAIIDVRLHGDDEDDESGLSLALALKTFIPRMNVILLTGFEVRAEQVVRSIRFLGVEDFAQKSDDLRAVVKEVLDRPSFEPGLNRLSLSLELGQPIAVRARGAHVYALRTNRILQLSVPRYNRLAQEASEASTPRFNAQSIGKNLYRDIFKDCPEVLSVFEAARVKSQPLCLSFEGARGFIGIPFEFVFLDQPADYLVLEHPVSRFINGIVPERRSLSPQFFAELKEKLRILIVASDTDPPIPGVDQEAKKLFNLLEKQKNVNAQVCLIPTEDATITRIEEELKNHRPHVFHYAGHGHYDDSSPEKSSLFFWSRKTRQGTITPLSIVKLKKLLSDSELRFAYFSCCYGTTTGSQDRLLDDDFLGIADAVIQAGVPSTLGYRWPASDTSASKLALAFYKSLLKQGSLEIALWEARRELSSQDRDDPTWLSPILINQV